MWSIVLHYMIHSNTNIYTLQTNTNYLSSVVHIETMISRGLYRFTLLGMNQKHASDAKDRVYAALRAGELLNLKSDNRKIIVSLYPDETEKKEGIYDLGIALSCVSCIDKNIPQENMLVVGGLSISGKILPSKRVYQSIYSAYRNNIRLIVCSSEDLKDVSVNMVHKINSYGIHIISATYIKDLIPLLKNNSTEEKIIQKIEILKNKPFQVHAPSININTLNETTRALYISLCGGHNIIIKTQSIVLFQKTYSYLYEYQPYITFGEKLYNSHSYKLLDDTDFKNHMYIEDIKKLQSLDMMQNQKNIVTATYITCPCGYQYSFFNTNKGTKGCICSKRTLIQHKRYIENKYFNVFDIHVNDVHTESFLVDIDLDAVQRLHTQIDILRRIQFFRYMLVNNINEKDMFFWGEDTYLNKKLICINPSDMCSPEAYNIWMKTEKDSRVLQIAQTIQDILNFESITDIEYIESLEEYIQYQKEKPAISEQALLLALSYIPKMDS
jgi:hypothetical protein